ncbi:hypothetical protein MK489_11175 [Myxococcota bacterium]|nr:hypothetical protein [Myxococcota bacterium]
MTALLAAACSSPKPILYPNPHYEAVGEATAQADIAECRRRADNAGASEGGPAAAETAKRTAVGAGVGATAGAVGGAIFGSAGRGAAVGAASGATAAALRSIFRPKRPSVAYQRFVDRCLYDLGYEPLGWE